MKQPPQSPWQSPPVFDEVSGRAGLPALVPLPNPFAKLPWFRTGWGIAAIALSAALIASLATAAIIISHFPGSNSALTPATGAASATTGSPLSTPPPTTASALPSATATPDVHAISDPVIGGTQDAFTARYGDPTITFDIPSYEVLVGNTNVKISLTDLEPGSDGQQRADILTVADPDGGTWDASTSATVVLRFLPSDAHHIRDDQTPDVGTLHVYQSADLAATFPASAFTNSNGGGMEPPGTFSYTCDAPGTIGCTIAVGE